MHMLFDYLMDILQWICLIQAEHAWGDVWHQPPHTLQQTLTGVGWACQDAPGPKKPSRSAIFYLGVPQETSCKHLLFSRVEESSAIFFGVPRLASLSLFMMLWVAKPKVVSERNIRILRFHCLPFLKHAPNMWERLSLWLPVVWKPHRSLELPIDFETRPTLLFGGVCRVHAWDKQRRHHVVVSCVLFWRGGGPNMGLVSFGVPKPWVSRTGSPASDVAWSAPAAGSRGSRGRSSARTRRPAGFLERFVLREARNPAKGQGDVGRPVELRAIWSPKSHDQHPRLSHEPLWLVSWCPLKPPNTHWSGLPNCKASRGLNLF